MDSADHSVRMKNLLVHYFTRTPSKLRAIAEIATGLASLELDISAPAVREINPAEHPDKNGFALQSVK